MITPVDRHQVEELLAAGDAVIVEALGPMYFEDAHLPGALNMPHDKVDELAPVLLPDRAVPIIVYCSNTACQNSAVASRRLDALGYQQVYEYVDGKQDWIEAGLPVERGAD